MLLLFMIGACVWVKRLSGATGVTRNDAIGKLEGCKDTGADAAGELYLARARVPMQQASQTPFGTEPSWFCRPRHVQWGRTHHARALGTCVVHGPSLISVVNRKPGEPVCLQPIALYCHTITGLKRVPYHWISPCPQTGSIRPPLLTHHSARAA